MKVVINKCFGGFGLSAAAIKELIKRKSKLIDIITIKQYCGGDNKKYKGDWEEEKNTFLGRLEDAGDGYQVQKLSGTLYKDGLVYTYDDNRDTRDDKDLVAVVRKLGSEANGNFAELKIVNVPNGVKYTIENYDGMGSIEEAHKTWS